MEYQQQDSFDIMSVYEILVRLGMTANYRGFQQCAYAVYLCVQNPDRLSMVTKWLYPDVARHCHTTARAVERNIRFVVLRAWTRNPVLMQELAGRPMVKAPTASQFFTILTYHFLIGSTVA